MEVAAQLEHHTNGIEPIGSQDSPPKTRTQKVSFLDLPNEILYHILTFLDVPDLLLTSRTSHLLRSISLTPILTHYRLRTVRATLSPLLASPFRPTLPELTARSIIMSQTALLTRRLGRSLASIRLSRRLANRPEVEVLVQRSVIPKECIPGMSRVTVAPAILERKKKVERELVKDGLRRWVGGVWERRVRMKAETIGGRQREMGVGRVWRLRRFWENMSKGGQ